MAFVDACTRTRRENGRCCVHRTDDHTRRSVNDAFDPQALPDGLRLRVFACLGLSEADIQALIGTSQVAVHGNTKEIEGEDDDAPVVERPTAGAEASGATAEGHSVSMLPPATIELSTTAMWSEAPPPPPVEYRHG